MEAEARLEHLEKLVQRLAQQGNASSGSDVPTNTRSQASHSTSTEQSNGGSHEDASGELAYSGSTHWSAMLEDIEELRYAIAPDETTDEQEVTASGNGLTGMDILFGSAVQLSFEQVLAKYLPSRQEADRLTAAYFRSKAVAAPFIHAPQFQRHYQAFWNDPANTPPLWTSIFFSICHIAINSLAARKETATEDVKFSIAAAHCLVIGEYFRPKRFAVESLLLWAQSRSFTCLEIPPEIGTVFGLIIRLATRMGYHRDPDHFDLSPFEKEMRRRTWSLCMQLDLLISFQMGLPSNVQFPTWDTSPPTNLLDSDFDESSQVLPPARPDSEFTDIMFYNAKHGLVKVFEKILRHALTTDVRYSTNVDELDTELRNTYNAIPGILRPRPMTESVFDPPYLIVTRLCKYFMYLKCLCVLHRKHAMHGRTVSIRACYDASSELVRCFVDAYTEFLPGGQNESERWFMSSITWNDFLLGAMALCLVLCAPNQSAAGADVGSAGTMDLLRRAQAVCLEQSTRSRDTQRVRKLIEATVTRFGLHYGSAISQASSGEVVLPANQTGSYDLLSQASEQYFANGLGVPSVMQPDLMTSADLDWASDDDMTRTIDDASWSYLEQFLNLSNDNLMPDI